MAWNPVTCRDNIIDVESRKQWASLPPKVLADQKELTHSELERVTTRARLMSLLGVVDQMDPNLPDEILKQLHYEKGVFKVSPEDEYRGMETTCQMASILTIFDRWDLADREMVKAWIVGWIKENRHISDAGRLYNLALGLIAVNATDEVPLTSLAKRIRPRISIISNQSIWGIAPYDINEYAIKEILTNYSGQGLVLVPPSSGAGRL